MRIIAFIEQPKVIEKILGPPRLVTHPSSQFTWRFRRGAISLTIIQQEHSGPELPTASEPIGYPVPVIRLSSFRFQG